LKAQHPIADDGTVSANQGRGTGEGSRVRLALVIACVGLVLVVAAVAAAAAIRASERAGAAEDVASSRALAAAAMRKLDEEPDLAMLLALEAFRRVDDRSASDSYEARNSLVSALTRYPHLAAVLPDGEGAAAVAFSSDGKLLATSAEDGTTRLWDVRRRRPVGRAMRGHWSCGDTDVRFTPDDRALVQMRCGFATVFDPSSGRVVRRLGGPTDERGEEHSYGLVSPDGRIVVVEGEWSGMQVLEAGTGETLAPRPTFTDGYRFPVAISGDSQLIATSRVYGSGRRTSRMSTLRAGAPVGDPIPGDIEALSPRGEVVVVVRAGAVSLWDVRRGHAIGRPLPVEDVLRATFDARGHRLAVSSDDGWVYVWRLTPTWRPRGLIRLRHDGVVGLRFDPTGETLATAASRGAVRLWDVTKRHPLLERIDATDSEEIAFSPDGEWLVANGTSATVVWTISRGVLGNRRILDRGIGYDIDFSADGDLIASGFEDPGVVGLWDISASRERKFITTRDYTVEDVAMSPDSRVVAASGENGVRFWDVDTGRRDGKRLGRAFEPIAFSPDGKVLVTGSVSESGFGDRTRTVRFVDVEERALLAASSEGTEPVDFAFSPDGRTLAATEESGDVSLWDVQGQTLLDRLEVDRSTRFGGAGVDFAPDGATLAVVNDNRVVLWDTAAGARLGEAVVTGDVGLSDVGVRPDGGALAAAGAGVFLLDPLLLSRDFGEWSRRLCAIASRNLSYLERRRYVDEEPFRETCGSG
jgi:WD40 repeat protein